MNIPRLFILLACMLCSMAGTAQSVFSISGTVRDENKEVVQYATMSLLDRKDSTLVDGCVTDGNGKYRLAAKAPGNYLLQSKMMGYQTFCGEVALARDTIYDITLSVDNQRLDEVVVTAERIKYDGNKYLVNMTNNPLAQGKSITGVVSYLPGVANVAGSLYVNGEAVSEIYINNRKVVDRGELEALDASDVLDIEVIPDAGQRIRASKSKAVIKIRLKKKQEFGYSGNVGLSGTFGKRQNLGRVSLPISYQKGKVNIYNYIRVNHTNYPYLREINTVYKQTDQAVETSSEDRSKGTSFSDVLNLVYNIDDRQEIGVSFNTMQRRMKESTSSISEFTGEKAYRSDYLLDGDRNVRQYQFAVNYNRQLDKKGSTLRVVGDYLNNRNSYDDQRKELYSAYFSNDTLANETDTKSEQMGLNVDVDIRRWKNTVLQFGGDAYSNNTSNEIAYFQGKAMTPLQNLCDDFRYKGTGMAAYADYERKIGSFRIGAACRLQNDRVKLFSYEENIGRRSYLNLFPELRLQYTFNTAKGLYARLYAKREMSPIRYSDMNPIRVYSSDISYEQGNPDLEPVTGYSIGINARVSRHLSFRYQYGKSDGNVARMTFVEDADKGITYRMPVNIGSSTSHSATFNYNHNLTSWWTLNATLQGYLSSLRYGENGRRTERLFFIIASDFRLSKTCGIEMNFFVEKGEQVVDTYYHTVYNHYWRVYKYFFNKKLTCSISGTNLLYRRRILTMENEIYKRREKNVTRRDYAAISITWRFKSGKAVKTKRTREILQMQETTIGQN